MKFKSIDNSGKINEHEGDIVYGDDKIEIVLDDAIGEYFGRDSQSDEYFRILTEEEASHYLDDKER